MDVCPHSDRTADRTKWSSRWNKGQEHLPRPAGVSVELYIQLPVPHMHVYVILPTKKGSVYG